MRGSVLLAVVAGCLTGVGGSWWVVGGVRRPSGPGERPGDGRARAQAEERRLLDRHRNEPIDARWRQRAVLQLRKDLARNAPLEQASLVGVDCRNTSCLAELEWKDFAAAWERYRNLLHRSTRPGCISTMNLAEPPAAVPYRVRLIVDCAKNRQAFE